MATINVPKYEEVSASNQAIFDDLKSKLGFVPNLYAMFAHSEYALGNYLALQHVKSSIVGMAREVVDLVVSQVNGSEYCLASHTVLSKNLGFTDEQVLEIRGGTASFDPKLDALARLVRNVVVNRGRADAALVLAFFSAGWTKENLVDTMVVIGDRTVSTYLDVVTGVLVDFPAAPKLPA